MRLIITKWSQYLLIQKLNKNLFEKPIRMIQRKEVKNYSEKYQLENVQLFKHGDNFK
jgi:hypothetical protein